MMVSCSELAASLPSATMLRFGVVVLVSTVMTLNYFLYSHFVHGWIKNHRFEPPNSGNSTHDDDHDHGHREHHGGGPFEGLYMQKDGLLVYGIALPLALLTIAALVWKSSPAGAIRRSTANSTTKRGFFNFFCRYELLSVSSFHTKSHLPKTNTLFSTIGTLSNQARGGCECYKVDHDNLSTPLVGDHV